MNRYEYQRLIDGTVEVLQKRSVRELVSSVEADGLATSEIVRLAVLNHPRTQQFIKFDMPRCQNEQEANEMFCLWLCEMQSFEAWARGARKYKGEECDEERSAEMPEWYKAYLRTEHWARKKMQSIELYKSCVLCSKSDGKIDTHHRTYKSLGNEPLWHLSVLCDRCHENVHTFLRLTFPTECPEEVQ